MKQIYEYLDYQLYLADYYKRNKEESKYFSLRSFAQRIGIDASYLSKVMKQQRHLGLPYVVPTIEALRLDESQASYFETLVYFNRERSTSQKQHYFEQLISLRKSHTHCLADVQFEFYRCWYYSALRNVLEFFPFYDGGDYAELGKQLSPSITPNQARTGVILLEKLDLIEKDDKGRFVLTETSITTGESWHSLAVRAFQEETIQLSKESLDRHEPGERDVSTVTMNITEAEFVEIKKMIKNFRSSVIKYVHGVGNPNRVYQLNMQMIPLSKENSEQESKGD